MDQALVKIHLHTIIQEDHGREFGPLLRMMSMIMSYDYTFVLNTRDIFQSVGTKSLENM